MRNGVRWVKVSRAAGAATLATGRPERTQYITLVVMRRYVSRL